MPTDHIIALLMAERDKLTRAIEMLQGSAKRPRRAVKVSASIEDGSAPTVKRTISSAARRKMSRAQKKRWAVMKAAKK